MKKTVGVITNDEYLFNKIRLAALDYADVFKAEEDTPTERFDRLIADVDFVEAPQGALTVSRRARCDMPIPFSFSALCDAIMGAKSAPLTLSEREKCAFLFGEKITLTELEFALLSKLMEKDDFTSREELLATLWQDEATGSVLNVYVHYLREKLEAGGEKIIVSSRRQGYKINEKFRKAD